MRVHQGVWDFIENNGGPEAFDPIKEPDSFLELQQQILSYETHGDPELAATYPPELLEEKARFYLDLEPVDDIPML